MQFMSDRKIAYILTVICYREIDSWEEYHTQHKALDMSIYDEMLSAVRENLSKYLPFVRYLRMSKEEVAVEEKLMTQQEKDIMLGFVYYSRSIGEWQAAKKRNIPITGDAVEFLLNGRFRMACENAEKLDDALMEQINIDVHNRMYTLIETERI